MTFIRHRIDNVKSRLRNRKLNDELYKLMTKDKWNAICFQCERIQISLFEIPSVGGAYVFRVNISAALLPTCKNNVTTTNTVNMFN